MTIYKLVCSYRNGEMVKVAKRKTLVKDFEQLVKDGDIEKIKEVFNKCDINAYGGYNKGNALSFLISEELMRWLVENGADIDYVDAYGYTPLLYHACHSFAEQQAINLVKLGANVHAVNKLYKMNTLHYAVSSGSVKLVQCLMEAGVDISAVDYNGNTPLESAFYSARTFDLIKLEPITKYLLSENIAVTEKLREYMIHTAKDIEFRRSSINKDYIDDLDKAMDSLYTLLSVTPVSRRVEYDGKSPIKYTQTTWQKQHNELWNLLVPGSGHANTVQGEVIRISGKLGYEILDNGGINWDKDYKMLSHALLDYLHMGTPLSDKEYEELDIIIKSIRNVYEKEIDRMTELSVKWVTLNLNPIKLGEIKYNR